MSNGANPMVVIADNIPPHLLDLRERRVKAVALVRQLCHDIAEAEAVELLGPVIPEQPPEAP